MRADQGLVLGGIYKLEDRQDGAVLALQAPALPPEAEGPLGGVSLASRASARQARRTPQHLLRYIESYLFISLLESRSSRAVPKA